MYVCIITYETRWHGTTQNKNTIGTHTTFAVRIDLILTPFPRERAFNLRRKPMCIPSVKIKIKN